MDNSKRDDGPLADRLDSPFLNAELFTHESSAEWEFRLEALELESPFHNALAWRQSPQMEQDDIERDFLAAELDTDEETLKEEDFFEFDAPTAVATARDPLLAVPAFSPQSRASIGALLSSLESKSAVRWNMERHPRASGVQPTDILSALKNYVDLGAVRQAIADYNTQNPSAPINMGTQPVDAVFVEAIHQFQRKCYRDAKESDGLAGTSVLDSLGFWPRKGMLASPETNNWARQRVAGRQTLIDAAIATMASDLGRDLRAGNWWSSFVNPSFLGWNFSRPIHIYFARKLRKAELWLLSQSRFAEKTPAEFAELFDIREKHAGGRAKATSRSIHTFGLAMDIKYLGNPHVGDYRDKPKGAKHFSEVMKKAAARLSGFTLTEEKFPQYLAKLGSDPAKSTAQIHQELSRRDHDLRQYLAFPEAKNDLAALRIGVFKGSQARDPLKGFLNLDKDLVIALRDQACLVWGAVDFGAGASGDIMHFDCRLDDLGRAAYCGVGGTFNTKHPCWNRSDPPCPEATRRTATSQREMSEAPTSGCEDCAAEFEDLLDEQDVSDEAYEADQELMEELEGTEDFTELLEHWMDALELEEEAVDAETPPLLHQETSNPPSQTLYVEIKLGKDSRCIEWVKENGQRKCVKSQKFVIKPMTGIFIPQNYSAKSPVDLILYLHGHKSGVPGFDAPISEYWNAQKHSDFALREEINVSQKNVILVAPTLALKSEAGDLVRPGGLDRYINKVLKALRAYGPYKNQTPTLGKIILVAHSGGGMYMRRLAVSENRAVRNIRECWGLDALYNSSDVRPWRKWAKADPQNRVFYSYYRTGLPKGSIAELPMVNSTKLAIDERGRPDKLTNVHALPSQTGDHFKLVCLYMRERLAATPVLQSRMEPQGIPEVLEEAEEDWHASELEDVEEMHGDEDLHEMEQEQETQGTPTVTAMSLMKDDLVTPIGEDEIIGLDGGDTLNIQLSIPVSEADARPHVKVEIVIRTPQKPEDKLVTRAVQVPKKGTDPNDPGSVVYQLSISAEDIRKILSPMDRVKEIATVRRIDGTSDTKLLRALGAGWRVRGKTEQAAQCGRSSGSLADERPDASKLIKAGGVAILELRDASNTVRVKRFVRNPADVFYYTGHGVGVGFSRRVGASSPMNCLAIEDHASLHGYCCWITPADLLTQWKSPMDLDVFIIAGCSVLAVDGSSGTLSGDGLEWAKLLTMNGGPLIALLGYGDWDANEDSGQGPMGATAPMDKGGGDTIASEIGTWIRNNPGLKGIIRKWLTINLDIRNNFAVGFDKNGYCWRTRRKNTPGWKVEESLTTQRGTRYVIEKRKIT